MMRQTPAALTAGVFLWLDYRTIFLQKNIDKSKLHAYNTSKGCDEDGFNLLIQRVGGW